MVSEWGFPSSKWLLKVGVDRFRDVLYFAQMRWPGLLDARTEGN
jgi:hypothetical protein